MLDVWLALGVMLAMGVFLLLGGPLWVARRLSFSEIGPEAPRWFEVVVWLASGLGGTVLVVFWLWVVTDGNTVRAFLLAVIIGLGLFLLVNGPLRLVVGSKALSRGRPAPRWMERVTIWFSRAVGAAAIAAGLFVPLWQWPLV